MTAPVCGVLLAGGLARRMGGGDKSLNTIGGVPILDRIIERVSPQVDHLMINANGDPDRFSNYGLPICEDVIEGFQGPLAGILTGLKWASKAHPEAKYLISFATDAPFVPKSLAAKLLAAVEAGADLACAITGDRTHPVFGIWPIALAAELEQAMVNEGMRKIDKWTARYNIVHVPFSVDPVDPFFNVNKPENLAEAEVLLAASL